MTDEYRIKYNKTPEGEKRTDVIATGLPHALKRITNYVPPPEEKEIVLKNVPELDIDEFIKKECEKEIP